MPDKPIEVHKFGGTSVGSPERIERVAELVEHAARGARVCVVCSAMGGVTDTLVELARTGDPGNGTDPVGGLVEGLERRHREAAAALGITPRDPEHAQLDALLGELREMASIAHRLTGGPGFGSQGGFGGTPPALRDRIVSMGERLSVRLVTRALRDRGVDAEAVDADTFLATNDAFGEADPLSYTDDAATRDALSGFLGRGAVPVVTGFIGRGPDGLTRLLGRGGSDFTAALLAASLGARELVIWTDVEGVFTSDPRTVPNAATIARMRYREAGEMAFFGSKVLHPRTMIPVKRAGVPTSVRSTLRPEGLSTIIDTEALGSGTLALGVSSMRDAALVSLEGGGIAGAAGVSARLFSALAAARVSVVLISQGSSECSVCVGVAAPDADAAEAAVRGAFAGEIASGLVERIRVHREVSVLTAVGSGMTHHVGAMSAMSTAIARSGTNIHAIAQGSSELSVSFAIERDDLHRATRALHDAVLDRTPRMGVMLVGLGRVGRATARLIAERTPHRVLAMADSSGFVLDPVGLDAARVGAINEAKADGTRVADIDGATPYSGKSGSVDDLIDAWSATGAPNPVLIDCTASGAMIAPITRALSSGIDAACANKETHASAPDAWARVLSAARAGGAMIRGESTVGAGLPVARTIETLLEAGDRITRIDAALSGTIGYLLGRLNEGDPLDAAVLGAIEHGYAEPDPRADIHGDDLRRKARILGRLAGFPEGDEQVEPFCELPNDDPRSDDSRAAMDRAGAALRERIQACAANGAELGYACSVEADGTRRVGFVERAPGDPMFGIKGIEACAVIRTEFNGDLGVVVRGCGAGPEPTAGGVLADLAIIAQRRSLVRPHPKEPDHDAGEQHDARGQA